MRKALSRRRPLPRETTKERVRTTTKCALWTILVVSLIDLQLTYVLAFMGKDQVVESLSSTIATTIVGVILGYFAKAFAETFAEKREERLNNVINLSEYQGTDISEEVDAA